MKQMMSFLSVIVIATVGFAQTQEFNASLIKTVKIENSTGDIAVTTGTGPALVTVIPSKKDTSCEQTIQMNGSELLVKIAKKGFIKNCTVDLRLQVPAKVDIAIVNGVGDLNIAGIEGAIRYDLGVGDVTIDAPTAKLNGNLGTGDLKASGLVGSAQLNTGTGDFRVAYKEAPQAGLVSLQVGTGDAEVLLPKNTKFTTDYQSAVGGITNELTVTKEAKFKVSFQTAAGDLEIKKL